MRRHVYLLAVTLITGCESASSTPETPSTTVDAGNTAADATAIGDASADARNCTLGEGDRIDGGFPRMVVDEAKLGVICFTRDAGTVAGCDAGQPCGLYRLPSDPEGTGRCGPGCDAISCPGEFTCTTGFSNPGQFGCDCE